MSGSLGHGGGDGNPLLEGGRSQGAGERSQGLALVGKGVFLAVFLCVARTWRAVFALFHKMCREEEGLYVDTESLVPAALTLCSDLGAVNRGESSKYLGVLSHRVDCGSHFSSGC